MDDRSSALAFRLSRPGDRPSGDPAVAFRSIDGSSKTGIAAWFRGRDERMIRTVNVVMAAIGLVITAPLIVLIAAMIKLTSRGPVFYRQTRIGIDRRSAATDIPGCRRQRDQGGRPFRIFKFRTMTTDSDARGQVWATPDDPRVTPVGAVLRRYRLDELPQLFNVLRGNMNIVGPRPEQPDLFVQLREKVDRYQERQRAHPGITGWAQINHSYDSCLDDVKRKVQLDLEYLEQRSVARDLEIMLKTLPVMVFRKGAW